MTQSFESKYEYIMVTKGSIISKTNPNYTENDPSTHANILVKLDEDICVCVQDDDFYGTIVFRAD